MDPSSASGSSSSRGPASFSTQADALLRKNLIFQKRNTKTNACIISYPLVLCIIIVIIQVIVNKELDKPKNRCGCKCIPTNSSGRCEEVCGIQYSDAIQAETCAVPSPPRWPALMQVPRPEYRAVRSGSVWAQDFPDRSCRMTGSCPATLLYTGKNKSLAESLAGNFLPEISSLNFSDYLNALSNIIPGTDAPTSLTEFIENAFVSDRPLYVLQPRCSGDSVVSLDIEVSGIDLQQEVRCVQGLPLWRDNTSVINDELFKGYWKANTVENTNEFLAAYDFLESNENRFSVDVWYNSTYKNYTNDFTPPALLRVPRSLNLASNAFLKFVRGTGMMMQLEYVKEMPQPAKKIRLDFSSLLGPLFFTWVIQLLFPVILTYIVYDKQHKLKIMMKMHGLKDSPYWIISHAYFFAMSLFYMLCFVMFGTVIGLKFFTLNDYSIQFVFYVIYINLQIAFAFLVSVSFSDTKTATVSAYIYVFGSGLLGRFLLQNFVEDTSFPKAWIVVLEFVPAFSLYRGLYEFGEYAFTGNLMGTNGMRWRNINDSQNGMKGVLIVMTAECIVLLPFAYYLHQMSSPAGGIKSPLFFLQCLRKRRSPSFRKPSLQRDTSKVFVDMERPDVAQEREVVEKLMMEPSNTHTIVCDNLNKVYPGKDGNPPKFAVKGLSLAISRGECFGMLGPNGAGKTSFINMMIGLISPSSGTALVQGLDIQSNMVEIYSNMGVCPQHDLLWERLTGREHLMFYGRLKNLKGVALMQAVDESLKNVNLYYGGVGDKQAGQYSGGMKRRLSVAISLIGDPKVVYMDEPSTGLDPASRKNLWDVVKKAKTDRAIILTTHSMEEAEVLCDRLGILVGGNVQCIGNPKEPYNWCMMTAEGQVWRKLHIHNDNILK
ncbi:ABC transporter A family member 7-like isoform X2 [Asparagus officinalis]|uniref:ABC transporter A family member 7-like isoform X2 n=1 Tax=Asparagus officinalis TaxID=4686 RepID=UPI00098E1E61|nr:ABC transporter A family member 7-like isoform X2 [Asparagus officinalis]